MKVLWLMALLAFTICLSASGQQLLGHKYSFLTLDGGITTLQQRHDTLYEFSCRSTEFCFPKPNHHYKILSATKQDEFHIVRFEALDTIALTSDPYPPTRFGVLVFQNLNPQQLGYYMAHRGLTKAEAGSTSLSTSELREKFYFSFFSSSYLAKVRQLNPLTTPEDAQRLQEELKRPAYAKLTETWHKTNTQDLYASGLMAELVNRACLVLGFSPWGVGVSLNSLLKH